MRHTLPGDNYTIISLQSNEGVKDFFLIRHTFSSDYLVSCNYTI